MVGPDYHRPSEPRTAAGPFVDPGTTNVSTAPAQGQWWHLFEDPTLDRLVAEALAYNSDVRVAAANLRRARSVLEEERGNLLPGGEANAQYSYERDGANAGQGQNAQTDTHSFYNVGIDAGYQVDLWGGIRRGIEAAKGDVGAAQAALDAARITVASETARMYAQACGFAAQAQVTRDTAELQQKTLDLTRRLMAAGRGTQRDVDQAVVLTENARAQVPQLEAERRASLYALAALTGRTPAEVDTEAAHCMVPPDVCRLIPIGDGAALIARRPDVRRAERQLAADTARIGVAVSELYPSITLLGSISLGARRLSDLSDKDSLSFSLGPLIQWNLANLTQGRSRIHQAEARTDASLASFDGAVLTALKEVEQALARYSGEIERNVALRHAEAAASNAARIAEARFDAGRDSFLQRLDAERDRAAARGALAQSNTALAQAQVALFNALGGGWEQAPQPVRRDAGIPADRSP
jgi:NodT family efflux transporter outer membrane factor (OMF) lipoprotein